MAGISNIISFRTKRKQMIYTANFKESISVLMRENSEKIVLRTGQN